MAALHGELNRFKGKTLTALSQTQMESTLSTWDVRVQTTLYKDGRYRVSVTDRATGKVVNELNGCYAPEGE